MINHVTRVCNQEGCTTLGHNVGHGKRGPLCTKHQGIKSGSYGWEYKKYRKDYCENVDGRLEFVCTTTILAPTLQLDADHIDGDPSNNDETNIQTLCKCCHAMKTMQSKDYLTPGRTSQKKLILEVA